MKLHAQLYMRTGCHLCEVAEADLRRLAHSLRHEPRPSRVNRLSRRLSGPTADAAQRLEPIEADLELIDIDLAGNAELLARFNERVPVVAIRGREYAAPLSPELLDEALRAAARSAAGEGQPDAATAGEASVRGQVMPAAQVMPARLVIPAQQATNAGKAALAGGATPAEQQSATTGVEFSPAHGGRGAAPSEGDSSAGSDAP